MADPNDRQGEESPETGDKIKLADLYESMSKILRENLERAGMLTEDVFERALNEARDWAFKLKENHGEDIGKVSEFIRRDWHEAIRLTGEQARKSLDPDRLQAGLLGLLSQLAKSAGSRLEAFASKLKERLTYRTGEIAGAGTLACNHCEQKLVLDKPAPIPPCSKCGGNSFTRSY